MENAEKKKKSFLLIILLLACIFFASRTYNPGILNISEAKENYPENSSYPENLSYPENYSKYTLHENISVTIFWVGEEATEDNGFISNLQSAWDDRWLEHSADENAFYFALPYNDFDEDERKSGSEEIYWAKEKNWSESESMCKNRWIRIIKGNSTAYAQWEDVGPFEEDDLDYVFGDSLPKNKINNNAGLDVSPAVRDYLNLEDIDSVSWQFVDFSEVPAGPWKTAITSSRIFWE